MLIPAKLNAGCGQPGRATEMRRNENTARDLTSAQQLPASDLERLKTVANAVHLAALNLAMTYGVFQGQFGSYKASD